MGKTGAYAARRLLLQIVLALLAAVAPARAAEPVPDWAPETITVSSHRAGPLFWRVSRGAAEVWILPVVGAMPEDLAWDHTQFDALLDGAKHVWLQPRAEAGFFEVSWFLLTHRDAFDLPNDAHLEDVLPQPLRARFVAERTKLGRDADRYEENIPAWAGFRLYWDFLDQADLKLGEPAHTIERLADHKDVDASPVATFEAMPVIKGLDTMSEEANRRCLDSALNDIAAQDAHQAAAARAWAVGDLAGMKRNYSESTLLACLQPIPSFAAAWAQSVTDTTKAIDAALAGGGRSILVTSLGTLLRKDGILDRLRAEGVAVDEPE